MEALTKLNFADLAEKVVKSMIYTDRKGNAKINLTTSKIRKLLSMTNVLYNQVSQDLNPKLNEDIQKDIQYLKMRFAYEAGREPKEVKPFVKDAKIFEYLNDIGDSREKLILFCNYIEALVAYHKFYSENLR